MINRWKKRKKLNMQTQIHDEWYDAQRNSYQGD